MQVVSIVGSIRGTYMLSILRCNKAHPRSLVRLSLTRSMTHGWSWKLVDEQTGRFSLHRSCFGAVCELRVPCRMKHGNFQLLSRSSRNRSAQEAPSGRKRVCKQSTVPQEAVTVTSIMPSVADCSALSDNKDFAVGQSFADGSN
jgi:hypothetical protein